MNNKLLPFLWIAFAASTLIFTGCKKDKNTSITGKYVIVSGGQSTYKYLEFTEDSIYIMQEIGDYGRRGLTYTDIVITTDSIYIYGVPMAYSLDGDNLTILGWNTTPVVAAKNMNVPSARQWVKRASVTNLGAITNPSSGGFSDMTSYGGDIITDPHNNGTKYVYKRLSIGTNSYTATEIDADPTKIYVAYEDNVEYMNGKLLVYEWGNPNSYLNRVNASTGMWESRAQVNNPPGNIYALATPNGSDLYGMTYGGIRKYDFVNDQWGTEISIGGAAALAGKDGFLFLTVQSDRVIQKYDPTSYKVVDAYELPNNYNVRGMAFAGNFLVVSVYNYNTTGYELIKIQM